MCVSCAWAKPAKTHPLEFCENGAKATAWEITSRRADPAFFDRHTLTELETWLDHDLEEQGRLTHPMRWDPATDKYVPVPWASAFEEIGRELRATDPQKVEFYTSGRASLETSYMYQLFARIFGSNNLPDSSNMCHESSSVALPESIGASVGTAILSDFQNCDCIFYMAQNVGTSSPRMLHDLQDAAGRGVKIVTFNPLREPGLERFVNPQAPSEMLTGKATQISSNYYQVRLGGDIAALFGICKALIVADDALHGARISKVSSSDGVPTDPSNAASIAFAASIAAADKKHILDHDFIAEHTSGFEEFAQAARDYEWPELERVSGLTREQMMEAARIYAASDAVLMVYGMGLTQHIMGVQNVHMVVNLALLRGNIGKPGANICAVRGHSNVQGQRTVGITEKPALVPLDRLSELYHFDPPRWEGHTTVDTCRSILDGETQAFVGLGGQFPQGGAGDRRHGGGMAQASPDGADRHQTQSQPCRSRGDRLPASLSWPHRDRRAGKRSAGRLDGKLRCAFPRLTRHGQTRQSRTPVRTCHHRRNGQGDADPRQRSLGSLGRGLFGSPPRDRENLSRDFQGLQQAPFPTGRYPTPVAGEERKWVTSNGKANFITPDRLFPELPAAAMGEDVLHLASLRSNDQFNTTIYGYSDRFRGVDGTRQVLFMNMQDIARLGFADGDIVDLITAIEPETRRTVPGFRIVAHDIPQGCCGAYYPETNPLFPLAHHSPESKTPSYKLLPVRLSRSSHIPVN